MVVEKKTSFNFFSGQIYLVQLLQPFGELQNLWHPMPSPKLRPSNQDHTASLNAFKVMMIGC
jgi:hypothetical protein